MNDYLDEDLQDGTQEVQAEKKYSEPANSNIVLEHFC